jgi:hypothetical protein
MPGTEGYQDGPARDAKFFHPCVVPLPCCVLCGHRTPRDVCVGRSGLDVDVDGNVFVADQGNHSIRLITAVDGMVYTVAGCGKRGKQDGDAGQVCDLRFLTWKATVATIVVASYRRHS